MSEPLALRPPAETRISNEARLLASRLRRAEQRLTAAQEEADAVTDELTALHRRAEERFGRPITPDALLLDVLASVVITDRDVWLWRGMRNNHGLPTVKYVEGRRNQEKSVVRYLAIAFGVITDEDNGVLYPDEDADDINPWHRTLRRSPEPTGNRWRFQPKLQEAPDA